MYVYVRPYDSQRKVQSACVTKTKNCKYTFKANEKKLYIYVYIQIIAIYKRIVN